MASMGLACSRSHAWATVAVLQWPHPALDTSYVPTPGISHHTTSLPEKTPQIHRVSWSCPSDLCRMRDHAWGQEGTINKFPSKVTLLHNKLKYKHCSDKTAVVSSQFAEGKPC